MKKKNQQPAPAINVSVYDGSDHIGFVVERGGKFRATDFAGKLIGTFAKQLDATRAIPPAKKVRRVAVR